MVIFHFYFKAQHLAYQLINVCVRVVCKIFKMYLKKSRCEDENIVSPHKVQTMAFCSVLNLYITDSQI